MSGRDLPPSDEQARPIPLNANDEVPLEEIVRVLAGNIPIKSRAQVNPTNGRVIEEPDTGNVYIGNGSAWIDAADALGLNTAKTVTEEGVFGNNWADFEIGIYDGDYVAWNHRKTQVEKSHSTDVGAVLQAAYDALSGAASDGADQGIIFVQAGEYTYSTATSVSAERVTLEGANMRSTRLVQADSADVNFIEYEGSSDRYFNVFRDIYVDGNRNNNASGSAFYFDDSVNGGRIRDARWQRVWLQGFPEYGIHFSNAWGNRVYDSVIERTDKAGVHVHAGRDFKAIGNKVNDCLKGFVLRGDHAQLLANIIQINKEHGVNISGGATGNIVAHNLLRRNGQDSQFNYAQVQVNSATEENNYIGGNAVVGGSGETAIGVYLRDGGSGGPKWTVVEGNVYHDLNNTELRDDGYRTRHNSRIEGSYTGDGTQNRLIDLKMHPSVVYVEESGGTLFEVRDDSLSLINGSSPTGELSIHDQGFEVGDNGGDADPNTDTETYNFVAIA